MSDGFTKEIDQQINERLAKAFKAVIDQQIASNEPPETAQTLERLQEEGYSETEAYSLISQVISREVAGNVINGQGIDMARYCQALSQLPDPFVKPK